MASGHVDGDFGDSLPFACGSRIWSGILMAFGARLAGGCTSATASAERCNSTRLPGLAVICFFIGGIAVAMTLFKF